MIHFNETNLSDCYKDAYGFRPRNYKEWWTKEELEKEYKYLSSVCEEAMNIEKNREKECLVEFNKLIDNTISHGAGDRETAIKWLADAEDLNIDYKQDLEYFFWLYGIKTLCGN